MSLYSYGFQLLPRPERSIFSIGSEQTRAILPDFNTVAQLSNFTRRLLVFHLPIDSVYVQIKFGASFVCLLLIVVSLILARKLYEGSFWLVRVIKRPGGGLLVPNSILAFSFVEGIYAVILVAFFWEICNFFQSETQRPTNLMLWLSLTWTPLIHGALWAAWGTYFATPNALQSSLDGSRGSLIKRIFMRPRVVNALAFFVPFALSVSVIVPGIVSNVYWQRALRMEAAWQMQYANEQRFTQQMVQASQAVWFETLKALKIVCVCFAIWTAHAIWVAFAYLGVSWSLISAIRGELKKQRKLHDRKNQMFPTMLVTTHHEEEEALEDQEAMVKQDAKGLTGNHLFTQAEMEGNLPSDSFFPRVRPEQIVGRHGGRSSAHPADTTGKKAGAEQQRAKEKGRRRISSSASSSEVSSTMTQGNHLRNALRHIYIQVCAVSPAALSYGAVALTLCLTLYGKVEQPTPVGDLAGNQVGYAISAALITVVWVTVVFGGVTLLAIAHKTYEPVLSLTLPPISAGPLHLPLSPTIPKEARRKPDTQSSFFETQTQPHAYRPTPLQQQLSDTQRGGTKKERLLRVGEEVELPNWNTVDNVVIERTVEVREELKSSPALGDRSSLVLSDDDFFKGGTGRRARGSR